MVCLDVTQDLTQSMYIFRVAEQIPWLGLLITFKDQAEKVLWFSVLQQLQFLDEKTAEKG